MKSILKSKNRTFSEWFMLLPNTIASLVDLVFCIPVLGRITKWVWNSLITFVHLLFGLFELLLWGFGFRPQKILRIGFIILHGENNLPLTSADAIFPAIRKAQDIFQQAKIKIIPAYPPPKKMSETGELPEGETWVRTISHPESSRLLHVDCNLRAMLQDLGLVGAYFQYRTLGEFFETSFRRLTGYGAPITVFMVKDIRGFGGCSIGWLSDYVTVKSNQPFTTAHELGHACNLLHRSDKTNLMHPSSGKQDTILLTAWQIALMRASRHVTLF